MFVSFAKCNWMEIEYFTYVLHEFSFSIKIVAMTAGICTVKKNKSKKTSEKVGGHSVESWHLKKTSLKKQAKKQVLTERV